MQLRFGGARYSAMCAIGYELDGIGELDGVELPRADVETDQAYRERLIVKLDWLCGYSKPIELATMDDFSKYRMWLEKSTLAEIGGLNYFVQQVGFENGRFGAWLMPAVPLQLIDHTHSNRATGETRAPDEPKRDTSVRDAVRGNW